ncbi:cell division protein FtsZ [Rhodovibrio sodomensis]|uniref:Cell division protein FtsZ n=1 Tax=Rhodovibrio sodomensis TaxID=1088 RepID=A0ABS1D8X9_9PROT|nr:cell division protein FtsZ [Rhodovibrio sodomensis]MBK1666825.1 cell division protein FtsZ [Rhodovibrio sodomensis]
MTLNLHAPTTEEQLQPRITVVGTGGAGGNAVNNMINSNLEGVEFLVCNTDAQALAGSQCPQRLQLGRNITQGLGAGSRPDVGRAAAEEAIDDLMAHLDGSNMVFITAGMGGGTGTGAAPVIARAAREKGILTVGVVTKPFHFEGVHRMRLAEQGIQELQEYVDTLIIIPNQNLFRVANEKTTFADAFKMADDVLYSGVRGVTDLMVMPGLINLDFADIRSVMTEMGKAMMGTGEAADENRAISAAEAAISNPLLDDVSMKGARGVLINITGGSDMTLFEVDEAANRIRDEVDPDANIIFGSTFDQSMDGTMRVSVVATGIDAEEAERPKPVTLSVVSGGEKQQAQQNRQATQNTAQAVAEELRQQPASASAQETAEMPAMAATGTDGGYAESRDYTQQATAAAAQPAYGPADEPAEPEAAREDAFIAPAPAQAPRQPKARQADYPAEERAQAARTGAAQNTERGGETGLKRKGRSLFARVTGAARSTSTAPEREAPAAPRRAEEPTLATGQRAAQPQARQPESRQPESRQPEPHQPEPAREPAGETRTQARPQAARAEARPEPQRESSQPRLSGLDPADRHDPAQDDDQLDIPAFLRRQAN